MNQCDCYSISSCNKVKTYHHIHKLKILTLKSLYENDIDINTYQIYSIDIYALPWGELAQYSLL
jgi:hypothetical protein